MGALFPPELQSSKISGMCCLTDRLPQDHALTIRCRAVCYNGAVYEAPHVYDPERFLKNGKLDSSFNDPEERIFGSGRRLYVSFSLR